MLTAAWQCGGARARDRIGHVTALSSSAAARHNNVCIYTDTVDLRGSGLCNQTMAYLHCTTTPTVESPMHLYDKVYTSLVWLQSG